MATTAVKPIKFTIEADHHRNSDLLIQSIPGCRLRSALVATRTIKLPNGEEAVPTSQVRLLSQFPRLPGMQLTVNSTNNSYTISDPLADDEELEERLTQALRRQRLHHGQNRVKGVPTVTNQLDQHRFKTLCREMIWLLNSDSATPKRGTVPSLEDIEALPGEFLLNPGSMIPNSQPMFEKDWDDWVRDLHRVGG